MNNMLPVQEMHWTDVDVLQKPEMYIGSDEFEATLHAKSR